ncbi:MAG: hypothetical protein M1334_04350 [Patescibacteria group bacterium]|nr:hypothetical protein [Patescibacteria group bacterium]
MKMFPSLSKAELEKSERYFQEWLNAIPPWKAKELDLAVRDRGLNKMAGYNGVTFYEDSGSGEFTDFHYQSNIAWISIIGPWTKIRIKHAIKKMSDEDRKTFLEWLDLCERVKGYYFEHNDNWSHHHLHQFDSYDDDTPSEVVNIFMGFYEAHEILQEREAARKKREKEIAKNNKAADYQSRVKRGSKFLNQLKSLFQREASN